MLKDFVVLYYTTENAAITPLTFICNTKDYEHAEEKFFNTYPEYFIAFIYQTNNVEIALDYYLNR